jgi:hypothetical protein
MPAKNQNISHRCGPFIITRSLVRARGWQLFNVNNLKLARFKEIIPAAAKSDRIDSAKTLELVQLRDVCMANF